MSDDGRAALDYHERTSHTEARLRADRHGLDWDNQPIPFKLYPDLEPIPLPQEWTPLEVPALRAIAPPEIPRDAGERVPDLVALARVLFLAAGITKVKRYSGGEVYLRAYPNTGALHHVDLYVVCADLPGLEAGVYHFGPHDFALRRLRAGDHRARLVEATGGEPHLARAPLVVASASTYWRNAWKYRARAYRHCYWDGGTLHANLLAAAEAEGLGAHLVMGFADPAVERLLGLDPAREGALALVALGHTERPPPTPPPAPALSLKVAPVSPHEVDYPEIRAVHAASSLRSGEEAARWRSRRVPAAGPPPARRVSEGPADSLEAVVRRRGSTRRFDPGASLSRAELETVLECATAGLRADFVEPGATLVEPYLICHSVTDLRMGKYYYAPASRELVCLEEGDFRSAAGRLGLFQELPAMACANLYLLARLDRVVERLGSRGYRAAQLEGGIAGGRAYLAAYAQGFGASGLTFLDHEVVDFFSPHARGKSVLFLVALGRAARSRKEY